MTRFSTNSVFNLDWSATSSNRDIEKAATKVTSAIEKGTDKIEKGGQRNTDKIAGAIKDNTEKVVDAVKKITTNETGSNQNVPLAVKAIHKGLMNVAETTSRIANHLIAHPNEMRGATEAAESIGKQFSELVRAASQYEEGTSKLNGMVNELSKVSDWIDCRFPTSGGNQSGMVHNTVAPTPPVVGYSFLQYWSD
jgi:microcompartment protein CcmL/EutN